MKFVWAFLIIITCLIPFLIGAGFGMDALLGYCSSDSYCRTYEICQNNECIDECAGMVCEENEYCDVIDHVTTCECQPGFRRSQTRKCEQRVYCTSNSNCDGSSRCINNTCINMCDVVSCGPLEKCHVVESTRAPECTCRSGYRRRSNSNSRCVKRCLINEDCDLSEACYNNTYCDSPCEGPKPPHSHCVPRKHEASYECDKCYRLTNDGQRCERDTQDGQCSSGI